MIINSLVKYYDRLLKDGEDKMPVMGYVSRKVKYILEINENGELLNIIPNTEPIIAGKKEIEVAKSFIVPDGGGRSSGIKPYFLCDNAKYLLGIDEKSDLGYSEKHFKATKELHTKLLENVDNGYAKSVLSFFENWDITKINEHSVIKEKLIDKEFLTTNLVFRIDAPMNSYAHENEEIKKIWNARFKEELGDIGLCMLTGKEVPIARLHGNIKGIPGGQAAGVSLVSYNANAFESFINSPISEEVAFKYVSALNKLLSTTKNKIRIGETTVLFFSENNSNVSDATMGFSMGANVDGDGELSTIFEKMVKGNPVEIKEEDFNSDFYIIGLAPNNARVAVRFFMKNNFGLFLENIQEHVDRFEIEGPPGKKEYLTPWELSQEALNKNAKEKNDDLVITLLKAMLTDSDYPISFISKILTRMKADLHGDDVVQKNAINYRRVGMIKAYLMKQSKYKEDITMPLNTKFDKPAYLLGRLFATYEKIQEDEGTHSNIKSNYFASASVTPASIFPNVVKSGELYLQKLQGGLRVNREKLVGTIMSMLPAAPLPKNLNFEEQNLFVLGYYHQRQDFFKKSEDKKNETTEAEEN